MCAPANKFQRLPAIGKITGGAVCGCAALVVTTRTQSVVNIRAEKPVSPPAFLIYPSRTM
jgi:hypothetical protein